MGRKDWTDDKIISRLLANQSVRSRWDNISELRRRPSKPLFEKCIELTKSKDPKIRCIGVDILAQLGLPPRPFIAQTLVLFFDMLNIETDPRVLMSLLSAINFNNDNLTKKQIEKLCSFSNNDNDLVKEGLVFSLLGIDSLNAIEVLIKLSSDKVSHIRNWATFGIGTQVERNNDSIRKALWNRVNDKHQETKLEAIFGLAKRKDHRVNEIIRRELARGEYGSLLLDAIIETRNKEFLPLLQQKLKLIKEDSTINPEWKSDLRNCMDALKRVNNES